LGVQLKAARERAGLSRDDVCERQGISKSGLGRWETGRGGIRVVDLRALLDLYGISDPAERAELETLAREGKQRGWWTPYTTSVRPTFATFLGLEAEAASLSEYTATIIPGLLQTDRYMRAVMASAVPQLDDATIERRIEVRKKRQAEMMSREYPAHFVIDDACLYRSIGGREVMAEQLAHIIDTARTRRITVQIIPFAVGAHASILGSFAVLTFNEMPPLACVEMLGGDLYADGADSLLYSSHFDKLREAALPEPLSVSHMHTIREDVHHAYESVA